jgi:hypothetical protein
VFESLVGFFKTDAVHLQEIGDSSITLPMATAKADVGRVRDELSAIDRNPGIQSTLTQDDVDGIEANLAYLQKKWRISANAMGAPSPMPPASEGFTTRQGGNWFTYFFGGEQEGFQVGSGSGSGSSTIPIISPGSGSSSTIPVISPGSGGSGSGGPGSGGPGSGDSGSSSTTTTIPSGSNGLVTISDLNNLSTQIVAEIVRLQASGAQDSTTQNRIKLLSTILQSVTDMVSGLQNGTIKPSDVTLKQSQVSNFLTDIHNPNSPLTNLLGDWGLPSGLSNLFPTYAAGDVSGADLAKQLFGKYIKDMSNLSWDVSLSYTGQAEKEIAANYASAMKDARYAADTTGTPTASNADQTSPSDGKPAAYRGLFNSVISSVSGQTPTSLNVAEGPTSGNGAMGNGGPQPGAPSSPFDWKERSKQICSQIRMREMDPYEFGCLKDQEEVRQQNFSWRGYTKMVCTRLATVYDPSVPELCGCPPPSWIGWRP